MCRCSKTVDGILTNYGNEQVDSTRVTATDLVHERGGHAAVDTPGQRADGVVVRTDLGRGADGSGWGQGHRLQRSTIRK